VTEFTVELLREVSAEFLGDLARETPEVWRDYMARRRRRVRGLYEALFDQGRAAGRIRKDIAPRVLTAIYLRLTYLAIDTQTLQEAEATSREMYRAVSLLFLHGVEGPRDAPKKQEEVSE
jgi:hypothetical protein